MVFAETLAGIALVKSAVEGIKGAIGTANDIGDIAGYVDKLLLGRDQALENKRKANANPFSVKGIAEETINAKLAEEHLDDMRQLIDYRFGHGTWAGIIAERARRIQEAKEEEKRKLHQKIREREELKETFKMFLIVIGSAISVLILAVLIIRGFIKW
tara:strand:- start:383 stop:856 length:474 start_codon:yes stop_codon:yes gene_type:complete